MNNKKLDVKLLRRKLIFSIVMAMVLLISAIVISTSFIQKNRQAFREQEYSTQLHKSVNHVIQHYIKDYTGIVNRSVHTTNIPELLKKRDREGMYALLKPKWNIMVYDEPNIEIMHVHLADGTSFLRVHKPEAFGDQLSEVRPMIKSIHTNHQLISGYETGKNAAVYRIIAPIFDEKNNYLGAFEIGINPNFIVDAVYNINGFCGLIFIKDDSLDLIGRSDSLLMDGYRLQTKQDLEKEALCEVLSIENIEDNMMIFSGDKKYRTYLFKLEDFQNRTKVKILFFQDLSEAGSFRINLLFGLLSLTIFILIFLTWFIYRSIGSYQKKVNKVYKTYIDELDKSENRFKLLYEKAPAAYQSLDFDGNILIVNSKWCEELGYPAEEVIGKNFEEFLVAEDISIFRENFPKFRELGETRDVDFKMLCKDGSVIDTTFYGTIISNEKGNFSHTQCSFNNVTESRKIEKELNTERKKLKNILNAMEDGVYVVNEEYDIEYVNPVLVKDFGDYKDVKCYKYFHDRDEVCPWCKNSEVHEGKTIRWEWYSSKNGKIYDLLDTPLYNSDGTISKLELFRDITESKIIEKKLRFNDNYLQAIFDVTPNIMITTNGEEIDRANPAMLEFFGYDTIESFKREHRCVCDFFMGDQECLRAKMDEITWLEYAIENKDKMHKVCMLKDGERHHFIVWAELLKVDNRNRSVVMFTDITDFKKLEDELRSSKQQFELFMQFMPANILIKDMNGTIVYANKSSNDFFNKESIVGMTAQDLLPLEIADKTDEFAKKVIECGVHEEVNTYDNHNGAEIIVRILGFQININTSIHIGIVMLDITQSYNDQQELRDQEEIMLVQSRHAAMGEMISMIAHQWRQPISVVAMDANNIIADIELESIEPKNLRKDVEDILIQTKHLSQTIDDFRNFFKTDKEKTKVLISDIFTESLGIIDKSLSDNNIEIENTFNTNTKITVFSRELLQVFINILNNSKEVLVENVENNRKISTQIYETESYIVVKICDNGGGIQEEIIEKIFDPYFSTKEQKNGTGLGLYMSQTIIEKHMNGKINANNSKDGACFNIEIPKEVADD